jgi:polyphenol oxidase
VKTPSTPPARVLWHASGAGLFAGLPEGFAAGFTTRRSAPDDPSPFPAARALAAALGAPKAEIVLSRQVHGCGILRVGGAPEPDGSLQLGEGDALVTRARGRLVAVASADCVPVLLLDAASGWIAAVHAGWRGTAARILDAVLDVFAAEGVPASRLIAAVGPSISRDRYEVGPEVAGALEESHRGLGVPASARRSGTGDRSFVDVAAYDTAVLRARGVPGGRILSAGLCTATKPALFPSYRRDGAGTGRIITGIVRR